MKVDIVKYYPDLETHPYPRYLSEAPKKGFEVGDVLYDEENNAIGMVLGCIDYAGGELRLDSDGMQPIENLRYATIEDFKVDRIKQELLEEMKEELSKNESKTAQ